MFLDSIFVGLVAGSVLVMTVFSDLSALAGPALRAMLADPSGYATSPGYLAFEPRMMQYSLALSAAQAVYAIVLLAWRGATFGQTICQIRVVPVDQGRHGGGLPIGQVLIRGVAFMLLYDLNTIVSVIAPDAATSFGWLLTLAGLLCVLWALWSPKKQCWHDMIARTQVVRPAG
ncbi:MAG: RDD family protein [Actinomycetia bacterium]|nr:RDD family protein [Actinomycetes bacterium]